MDSHRQAIEFYLEKRKLKKKRVSLDAGLNETALRDMLGRSSDPRLSTIIALCERMRVLPHALFPELVALYPPEAKKILDRLERNYERQLDILKESADIETELEKGKK